MTKGKVIKLTLLLGLVLFIQVSLQGCSSKTDEAAITVDPIAVIEEHMEAINNKDYEKAMANITKDFVYRDNFGEISDKEELKAFVEEVFELDGNFNVLSIEEMDNKIIVESIYTNFPTDYLGLTNKITETYEIENGKIKSITSMSDEEFLKAFEEGIAGGIGIAFEYEEAKAMIVDVLPDSPAEEAGLEIGDEIVRIDGYSVSDFTYGRYEVLHRIAGKIGTDVVLTLKQEDMQKEKEVKIKRVDIRKLIESSN